MAKTGLGGAVEIVVAIIKVLWILATPVIAAGVGGLIWYHGHDGRPDPACYFWSFVGVALVLFEVARLGDRTEVREVVAGVAWLFAWGFVGVAVAQAGRC